VHGGRALVGAAEGPATQKSSLNPVAQAAMAEFLSRTDAKRGKRRHVFIIKDGIRIPLETRKTDEEILADYSPPFVEPMPTASRPGHADLGQNPFDAAVAKAVAEQLAAQLALLGLPTLPPMNAPTPERRDIPLPAARRGNHHVRLAADIKWNEPCDPEATVTTRIERYMRHIRGKKLGYSYTTEHDRALRILSDVVGEKPVMDMSVDDMDDLVDVIGALPLNWSKKPAYSNLTAPEAAIKARKIGDAPSMLTSQQRLVTMIRTFLIWLETRKEVRPGLLLGVRLFQLGRDFGGQRDWFDPEELLNILSPEKEARFFSPWQTWILRIGLFAGMRQLEIAQLRVDDIVNVDGIWCIDICPDDKGKRVKNKTSRRKTPIHDELIKAGFLDYVAQAREAGVDRLFPDLYDCTAGVARKVTGWFSKYIRKTCLIKERTKTFHSLRHSFATLADRAELRDEHIMKLLGHSWGNTVLRRVYAQELNVREKHANLHRIKFPPIVMTPHRPERYERYFRIAYANQTRKARIDASYGVAPSRAYPRKA
jgi:integrase